MTVYSPIQTTTPLVDGFNRAITYVRMSVTDRCDLRCLYCMSEDMTFLPRKDLLTIEEMVILARTFTHQGVRKLRITGGEPLIRSGIITLMEALGELPLLDELCMTTNGTHLERYAQSLLDAGVDRINISLDSLQPERYKEMTRNGELARVLGGIEAAKKVGFKHLKLNCVALKNYNADEAADLVRFALDQEIDISFIEEMPLGRIDSHGRAAEFISSTDLRQKITHELALYPSNANTGGPARYWTHPGSAIKVGFISPHSDNFCSSCNRIRLTATGRLILCLGQDDSADLRKVLRDAPDNEVLLDAAIREALIHKPEKHTFDLNEAPQILRFMNATGG